MIRIDLSRESINQTYPKDLNPSYFWRHGCNAGVVCFFIYLDYGIWWFFYLHIILSLYLFPPPA